MSGIFKAKRSIKVSGTMIFIGDILKTFGTQLFVMKKNGMPFFFNYDPEKPMGKGWNKVLEEITQEELDNKMAVKISFAPA